MNLQLEGNSRWYTSLLRFPVRTVHAQRRHQVTPSILPYEVSAQSVHGNGVASALRMIVSRLAAVSRIPIGMNEYRYGISLIDMMTDSLEHALSHEVNRRLREVFVKNHLYERLFILYDSGDGSSIRVELCSSLILVQILLHRHVDVPYFTICVSIFPSSIAVTDNYASFPLEHRL
jgi:hypothetical protein